MTSSWEGEIVFDKAMELVQKRLSAICPDSQSMVE